MLSVVKNGEDGNGLKLDKTGQFFKFSSCVMKKLEKILWFALPSKFHVISFL